MKPETKCKVLPLPRGIWHIMTTKSKNGHLQVEKKPGFQ